MLWRHLSVARAWSALGLLTASLVGHSAFAEPEEPAPPADAVTRTVRVLEAQKAGDLNLDVRGSGQDRVRISLRNTTAKRLNVILPPGLVASSAAGQAAGRGAGGGGFQSMGLGTPTNRIGAFGQFESPADATGFRSVAVAEDALRQAVTVPAGQTINITLPSVCLNYGMPTPSLRDHFQLVDVVDYTKNLRARKALRSLAIVGTSQGVAQAAMWNVCNDVPFEEMAAQGGKLINAHEIALAGRFVEALDASGTSDRVDPAYLSEGRVFVHVEGEGALAKDAERLNPALDGLRVLGLPVRVVDQNVPTTPSLPALLLNVTLTASQAGQTSGRVHVSYAATADQWEPLGKTKLVEGSTSTVLDGPTLARAIDHAVAASFVTVKPARRNVGSTVLKFENRLPFTLANVFVKAGDSSGAPTVPFKGLGVGPTHSALAPIQAASASVERVELNGL